MIVEKLPKLPIAAQKNCISLQAGRKIYGVQLKNKSKMKVKFFYSNSNLNDNETGFLGHWVGGINS